MARKKRQEQKRYLMISAVAERFEIHPQTLRMYEREGLITPVRSAGNTRLYDDETLKRLETVLFLTRELGVNLAGVEVILNMREQMDQMRFEVDRVLEYVRHEMTSGQGVRRQHALVRVKTGLPVPSQDRDEG